MKLEVSDPLVFKNEDVEIYGSLTIFNGYSRRDFFEKVTEENLDLNSLTSMGEFALCIKRNSTISLIRDFTGRYKLYCYLGRDFLYASTNQHLIAKKYDLTVCPLAKELFIFTEFLTEPLCFYEELKQIERGEIFDVISGHVKSRSQLPKLASITENDLCLQENAVSLREKIIQAHERRIGSENAVFLSGGIDSSVSAIVLKKYLGLNKLSSGAFCVTGADQNEVPFAARVAKQLGLDFIECEVNPEECTEQYERYLNHPYFGFHLTSRLASALNPTANTNMHVFVGQDTRLHTPHINSFDKAMLENGLLRRLLKFLSPVVKMLSFHPQFNKAYQRSRYSGTLENYIISAFFHVHTENLKKAGLDDSNIFNSFRLDLDNLTSLRGLYNAIVDTAWNYQYTSDMDYMSRSISRSGSKPELPFYDWDLAQFSASIPMKYALHRTKGVSGYGAKPKAVDKFVLRQAFKDDLSPELIYRDKTVAITNPLFIKDIGRFDYSHSGFGKRIVNSYKLKKDYISSVELMNLMHMEFIGSK